MEGKKRIEWVDTLKGLGIFAIYLGHTGNAAGKLYPFVFTYHVALFFFAAGFFAGIKKDETVWQFLKKQVFRLAIPYFGFVILSVVVEYLQSGASVSVMLMQGLTGIRNQIFAGSLWFLPCMFVMAILYYLILRIVRKKGWALLVSTALFVLTQTVLKNNPALQPSWIWNVDSAMYYIVFYALGAFIFPYIKQFSFKGAKLWKKASVICFAGLSLAAAGIVLFRGAGAANLFPAGFWLTDWFLQIIIPLLIISANIFAAIGLQRIGILRSIGESTLILCGTEHIIKTLLFVFVGMFGLSINLTTPLAAVLYTAVCLLLCRYTFVIIINRYLPFMSGKSGLLYRKLNRA